METYHVIINNFPPDYDGNTYIIPVTTREKIDHEVRGLVSVVDYLPRVNKPLTIICSRPNISTAGELFVSRWSDEYIGDFQDNFMESMVYGD